MKKIITLAAIFAFSGTAFASEGNTVSDDVLAAILATGNYSASTYDSDEGNSVLVDATQIARIETMGTPPAYGSVDAFFQEESALGSTFDAE